METIRNSAMKILFMMLFCIFAFTPVFADTGVLTVKQGDTHVDFLNKSYQHLYLKTSVSSIGFMQTATREGTFTTLRVDGFGNRNVEGEPAVPVYHKLIEVPKGARFSVSISRQHYTDIRLADHGITTPVIPAQPPMSKNDDPDKVPFVFNRDFYNVNSFGHDELVAVTHVGMMRALNLARIDISPVQYNPVTKVLRVYDVLDFEIFFLDADVQGTIALKQAKSSPYFSAIYNQVGNYQPLEPTYQLIAAPPTYVIISDPMFTTILQPFIQWKTKKGFKVIEGYTNNASVGTTTTSIKSYLQGLYNTPPAGYSAPSFVLFVGDVAQIPSWTGSAGSHVTDLRYCEYTGDDLPEVYYGRFSATTLAQLQPQIDKTLEYERYLMPDPSFLGQAVMAAGADASHQTYSNGQINYGTENYFNLAHNITSHIYLQPEPSGAGYAANIHTNVSNGVAYSNYTAHCSESGWADPSFLISDIAGLTNQSKYGLMVGNCCMSCRFNVDCFAEEMLRAANKGTIGYIGGSNYTYWDEDYWWGSGFKTVALHPSYDASHLGAYDGTFHDHGEDISDWFVTQGQMVVCGDYAVEESTSSMKTYYWEIYHLMGDPSLMIYYGVPSAMTASYQNPVLIGTTSLTVNTEPYATVALSNSGTLLDAKLAGSTGQAVLNFSTLTAPGYLDIVITKQNKQPFISTVQVIPASGPYIVYNASAISDPTPSGNNNGAMDFGETNLLSITLKNVGIATASSVGATLSSTDSYLTITDNSAAYGDISANQTATISNGFALNVANNIPDQHVINFDLNAASGTDSWTSHFNITANAPVLGIGAMTVSDPAPGGNNNGILDPGETGTLSIVTTNTGHASLGNIIGNLAIVGGSSPYLTISNSTYTVGTLAAGGTGSAVFNVTASSSTPIGTPVDLTYTVTGGSAGQYSLQAAKQVVIGLIPTYVMSSTTVSTCTGNFYDPGGASGDYSSSTDYTMVFNPGVAGNMVRVAFNSFSLESQTTCSYDYLKIYDGNSISGTLLGTYCGTTSPGTVTASNATGSLTFVFHTDGSVVSSGWAAAVSCLSGVVANPASFTANPYSMSQINLAWTKNPASNNVMVAWSTSSTFGTPVNGTSYSAGNTIAGGGTVLYAGNGLTFNHTSLNQNTTYYYKAFSYDNTNTYSSGLASNATTVCGISSLPFSESFSGSSLPGCWSTQVSGTGGVDKWTVSTTTNAGGSANEMKSSYQSVSPGITRLITPALNTAGFVQLNLSFKHLLDAYGTGCTLRIQSSTDKITWTNETWSIASTSTNVGPATVSTTITNNLSSTNTYIAFEIDGNLYQYDYWYIDDVSVTGVAATLAVTPATRSVSADAGTTNFSVTSNTSWLAASNQTWCTVTPSGTGNGTITATYSQNTTPAPRTATILVAVAGLTPVPVTVTQAEAPLRTFNLSVFLEGLYAGEGEMTPAMDESTFHWGANIADKLTVELHNGSNYSNIIYTIPDVTLSTSGSATFAVPSSYNGNYYVTVLNHNHLLTTSATPVSFGNPVISYNFDSPEKAFGGNMQLMVDGKSVLFAGDVSRDGLVDSDDLSTISNLAAFAVTGYNAEDITGDGLVDSSDLAITANNAAYAISSSTP
jgi:hypothetical protein